MKPHTHSCLILVVLAGVGVEGTSESVLPVRPNFIRTLAPSTSLYGVMPGLSDQSYSVLERHELYGW